MVIHYSLPWMLAGQNDFGAGPAAARETTEADWRKRLTAAQRWNTALCRSSSRGPRRHSRFSR